MKKKVKVIIASVALFAIIVAGVVFGVIYSKPENIAIKSVSDALSDFEDRDEISPIVEMLSGGSLSLDVKKITSLNYKYFDYYYYDITKYNSATSLFGYDKTADIDLINADKSNAFKGTIYFDEDDQSIYIKGLDINYGNVDINGEAYLSPELVYVQESNILGGKYGLALDSLREDIKKSIFKYDVDDDGDPIDEYTLANWMTEEEYNALLDAIESVDFDDFTGDYNDITEYVIKTVWDVICDYATFTSTTKDVSLNGELEEVRVITIKADNEDIANMLTDIYHQLFIDDSEIKDFIREYDKLLYLSLIEDGVAVKYDSAVDYYEDRIFDLYDNIEEYAEELREEDGKIKVEVVTPKYSSKLLKLSASKYSGYYGEEEVLFSIDFGRSGVKSTDEINIRIGDDFYQYIVTEDSSDAFSCKFYDNGECILDYKLNRDTDVFTLSFVDCDDFINEIFDYKLDFGNSYYYYTPSSFDECKITGTLEESGSEIVIKPKNIKFISDYYDDEYSVWAEYEIDATITIDTSDSASPSTSGMKTIAKIKEETIEEWKENAEYMFD